MNEQESFFLAGVGAFSLFSLLMGLWRARTAGLLGVWAEFTVAGVCLGIALQDDDVTQYSMWAGALACCLHIIVSANRKQKAN